MHGSSLPTVKKNFFHPQIDESSFIFHFCGHQDLAKEKWGPDLSSLALPVAIVQLVRWQLSSHLSRNIPVWGRFSAPWVVPLGTVSCTTCFRHSCVDQPSSFVLSRNIWETNVPKYWEEKKNKTKQIYVFFTKCSINCQCLMWIHHEGHWLAFSRLFSSWFFWGI